MNSDARKLKQPQILGGIGAGIPGAGVAFLSASWLLPNEVAVLIVGMVTHGYAMFANERLEHGEHKVQA